jgi:hypothetical protein
MTCDVGNPGSDLEQAQKYDGIKLVKMGSQPFPE